MSDTITRDRMLGLPRDAFVAVHRALAAGRSPVEAADAARRLGFETGEGYYRALGDWLKDEGRGDPTELESGEFWSRLSEFFSRHGWGTLEYERLHEGVSALSSESWAEADPALRAAHPSCHFTTGLLADLLARVSDADPAVMEVECRSRGDARCRFVIGGGETLDRLYQEMREGASAAESIGRLG